MTTTSTEKPEKVDTTVLTIQPTDLIPLFTADGIQPLVANIEERARSFAFDVNTDDGRTGIRSLAANVARAKTTIDGAGKNLVADKKKELAKVDEARRVVRDRLSVLKEEVREPLTAWEEAEKIEVAAIQTETNIIEVWDDAHRENAERDELAQLRAEKEAAEKLRLEAEREEQIRKEVEEKAQRKIDEAERREAKAVATAERAEEEKRQAVEAERQRAHEEAVKKEQKRLDTEEQDRISATRKAANKAHREKINREIQASMIENGLTDVAEELIELISEGKIRHVAINY